MHPTTHRLIIAITSIGAYECSLHSTLRQGWAFGLCSQHACTLRSQMVASRSSLKRAIHDQHFLPDSDAKGSQEDHDAVGAPKVGDKNSKSKSHLRRSPPGKRRDWMQGAED